VIISFKCLFSFVFIFLTDATGTSSCKRAVCNVSVRSQKVASTLHLQRVKPATYLLPVVIQSRRSSSCVPNAAELTYCSCPAPTEVATNYQNDCAIFRKNFKHLLIGIFHKALLISKSRLVKIAFNVHATLLHTIYRVRDKTMWLLLLFLLVIF